MARSVPTFLSTNGRILSILQKTGFIPCKTIVCEETSQTTLVPAKAPLQLVRYQSCAFLNFGLLFFLIFLAKTWPKYDFTPLEFFKIGGGFNSDYDFKIFLSLVSTFHIFHFIIMYQLVNSKVKICEAQSEVQKSAKPFLSAYQVLTKSIQEDFRKHFFKLAFTMVGWVIFIIGFTINVAEEFDIEIAICVPFSFSYLLWIFWCVLRSPLVFISFSLLPNHIHFSCLDTNH